MVCAGEVDPVVSPGGQLDRKLTAGLPRPGIHLNSKAPPGRNRAPNDFPTKLLGNADRIAIFVFEEFPHECGRKPLSLAQIRRLEHALDSVRRIFRHWAPFSPPSGPATDSFNGLHPKSNFPAVQIQIGT
jgi:hypothetical protein